MMKHSPVKQRGDNLKRIATERKRIAKQTGTWYQPGAESKEISDYLKENGKNYIDDQCIMVVAK